MSPPYARMIYNYPINGNLFGGFGCVFKGLVLE